MFVGARIYRGVNQTIYSNSAGKMLLSVLKQLSQFTDIGGTTHHNPAMPEHYATSPDKHGLLPPWSRSPVWRVLSCQTYRMQSGLEKE